jgi:hypothetical protein
MARAVLFGPAMTHGGFLGFFAKSAFTTALVLVLVPVLGVYATAHGATVTPEPEQPSNAPAFSARVAVCSPVSSVSAPVSSESVVSAPAPRACMPKLRRLKTRELSTETIQVSASIVRAHYMDPIGTEIAFHSGKRNFVGRIERHYHEFDSKGRPWGYHKGCSLFEVTACE